MATTLEIDSELLAAAMELGEHGTQAAAVNEALREYVERRRQLQVVELFGTIDFDPSYDYKRERQRR